MPVSWDRHSFTLNFAVVLTVALLGLAARADEPGESAASRSTADQAVRQPIDVRVGPREPIRDRGKMPFVMDSSLPTLRRDAETWFFYHSVDWGKANEKYLGTVSNPFQTRVWHKTRDEMYDLNGWYADVHHAGVWLNNIYRTPSGDLLGVAHVELHHQAPAVNQGEDYAIGLAYSTVGGDRWTYCGEIVRPSNSKGNVGGTPMLAVGKHFHVYFNEHGPDGRRLAVARAPIGDVLAAARNRSVTPWHKYRDGAWNEPGLTGLGSAVLPGSTLRGGHPADLHADAAYNRAAGLYMVTSWCYGQGVGRLYLNVSRDGVHFDEPYLLDEEPGQWMPYSTFLAHPRDQETHDMSTVGGEFYVLINHKSAENYGIDSLSRRSVTISPK